MFNNGQRIMVEFVGTQLVRNAENQITMSRNSGVEKVESK